MELIISGWGRLRGADRNRWFKHSIWNMTDIETKQKIKKMVEEGKPFEIEAEFMTGTGKQTVQVKYIP